MAFRLRGVVKYCTYKCSCSKICYYYDRRWVDNLQNGPGKRIPNVNARNYGFNKFNLECSYIVSCALMDFLDMVDKQQQFMMVALQMVPRREREMDYDGQVTFSCLI